MDSDFQLVAGCEGAGLIRAYLESCGVYMVLRHEDEFFTTLPQCSVFLTQEQKEELRVIMKRGPQ